MISVIVPVYNVLPYLEQCVESLLSQTYAELEILLVDDGSTDGCAAVCDRYAASDRRIRVIHQANGGLSDARNAGMKAAGGEWICFADSDDWLAPRAIEKLHAFAVAEGCDAVQGNMYYAWEDHLLYRKADCRERRHRVLTRDEAMRALILNDRVKNFAWGKLYRSELIRDLAFPVGKFFEDSFWQHLVIDRTERYGIIDEPLYYYRQRSDSISGARSEKIRDLLDGYGCRLEFIRDRYPDLENLMKRKYDELYWNIYGSDRRMFAFVYILTKIRKRLTGPSYRKICL